MNSALDAWMMRSRVVDNGLSNLFGSEAAARTIILVTTVDSMDRTELRTDLWLAAAATFFAVAVLIHNSDHARRGVDSVSKDVFWVGTSSILLEVALVVVALQRHRLAALAAAAGGLALAAGYLVVHFLPERSWLSDSFTSATDVSPLSWFAASLEITAAVTLGVVGLVVLRDRGGLASAMRPNRAQRNLRDAVLHPVALAMIAGNAVILVVSLAQL
jgi:uncharacterized membrane protein YgdD (TMEM256/DUF423 family)